jgi:hypothetical protein
MKKNKPRILRSVTGTLYPKVEAGSGPSDRRLPHPSKDRQHYTHPVIKVNEYDVEEWNYLRGAPLWFEHAQNQRKAIQVGELVEGRVLKDDSLYIVASVYDIPEGEWAADRIEKGEITGFSIGYLPISNARGELVGKQLNEVSLVVKPFFPDTLISVCASDSNSYNTNNVNDAYQIFVPLNSNIMENQSSTTAAVPATTAAAAAPASTPPVQPTSQQAKSDPAAEIRNNVAEMELKVLQEQRRKEQEQMETLRKEREAYENELKGYREKERLAKEAEKSEKVKELDAALANIQRTLGVKELPREYVEGNRNLVKSAIDMQMDDPRKHVTEVMASFTKQIGNAAAAAVDERDKLRLELEELKTKMAQQEKEFSSTAERVRASRTAVYEQPSATTNTTTTTKAVEVKASSGSDIADLFLTVPKVKPGTREGQIYREQYQPQTSFLSYGINASNVSRPEETTVQVKPLPKHSRLSDCEGSIRNRVDADGNPCGEAWLSHIIHNFNPEAPTSAKFKIIASQTTVDKRF